MNGVIRSAVVLVVLGAAGVASAQPPPAPAGPAPQRPTFSPYLNLLRANNSTTLNYYGLVRPEQQFRQSIGTLQGAVNANQQAIGEMQANPAGGPAVTGHPVYFLNTGGYFQNTVGGAVGRGVTRPQTGGAGGAGGVPPPRR